MTAMKSLLSAELALLRDRIIRIEDSTTANTTTTMSALNETQSQERERVERPGDMGGTGANCAGGAGGTGTVCRIGARNSGAYHLPSAASHQPGPCDVSLMGAYGKPAIACGDSAREMFRT